MIKLSYHKHHVCIWLYFFSSPRCLFLIFASSLYLPITFQNLCLSRLRLSSSLSGFWKRKRKRLSLAAASKQAGGIATSEVNSFWRKRKRGSGCDPKIDRFQNLAPSLSPFHSFLSPFLVHFLRPHLSNVFCLLPLCFFYPFLFLFSLSFFVSS